MLQRMAIYYYSYVIFEYTTVNGYNFFSVELEKNIFTTRCAQPFFKIYKNFAER